MTNLFPSPGRAPATTLGHLALSMVEALGLMPTTSAPGPTITFGARRLSDWAAEVRSPGRPSMGKERRPNRGPVGTRHHEHGSLAVIAALLAKGQ